MHHPFQQTELIKAEVFTTLPGRFRKKGRNEWTEANRGGIEVECFLEGPAFDREGNLWVVDIPFGRIFRIDPQGEWELVIQYDGWPNGMKMHRDGRLFICDYRKGLLALDAKSAAYQIGESASPGRDYDYARGQSAGSTEHRRSRPRGL